MQTDLMPEATNIVRFPIERRSTMDLLRQMAPDVREVSLLAEIYEIVLPRDLEERADRAAAEHILNQVPAAGPERAEALREMLGHAVTSAIAAVRRSGSLAQEAAVARRQYAAATSGGGDWMQDLEQWASELAVDLAFRGETWTPRNHHAEMDWLIDVEAKRRAR